MIEGRTILCVASGYDAPPTSKHHVMHLLAGGNRVLWVSYHASRRAKGSTSELFYMAAKARQVLGGLRRARRNLYVLTPLAIPAPNLTWARGLNRLLMIKQIGSALSRLRRGPLQIWSFAPDVSYLLGRFGEERSVYYCVDDFASFTGYDRRQVLRDETDLCLRVDLVVTTSRALYEAKKALNPNTILVTHGVDHAHFARALSNHLPSPKDMAVIPRPRIGFFGLIRDWLDLDLLAAVARRRCDWHFVFIGDSMADLSRCRGLANVHFLGRRRYEDLPAYCKQFDVGLIPFKINELTRAVNPIKLREYLAAGLPVVSTPLPEVLYYRPLVRVADTAEGMVAAVESALAESPCCRRARSQLVSGETWPEKLDRICRKLQARPEFAAEQLAASAT